MNKQLIIYMTLGILCMLKMKKLKIMTKEISIFFVLQLVEVVLSIYQPIKVLIFNTLNIVLSRIQFSVSDSRFSVLVLESGKFNSLYWGFHSLYSNKLIQFITHSLSESGLLRGDKTVLDKSLFASLFSLFTINFSLK